MLDRNNLLGFPIKSPQASELAMDTATGYGSTGNTTVIYSSVNKRTGSAITHIPSSVYGSWFMISEDGSYAISANGESGSSLAIGITVNTPLSNLSSDIVGMSYLSGRRTFSSFGANNISVSATLRLSRGDIVRIQTNGAAVANGSRWMLNICKVSD